MPKDAFDKMMEFQAKHGAWIVFRSVYWAIYLLLLGGLLLYYTAQNIQVSLQFFMGYSFSILAMMIILYGAAETLHYKLMRKYL